MTLPQTGERDREWHLRLWPGVVAVTLLFIIRFGVPMVSPDFVIFGLLGGLVCALAVLVWWAFFSRVPHFERWGAIALIIVAVLATPRILDASIVGGMMGMMFRFSVIPGLCLALVAWALVSVSLGPVARRAALVAFILMACGFWALLRTDGITGAGGSQLAWRWSKTPEQKLLARTEIEPVTPPPAVAAKVETPVEPSAPSVAVRPADRPAVRTGSRTPAIWPGFRGPHRDNVVTGVRIRTDWAASPPVEMWRRPVGPGWSSFAVGDGLVYTQEQRGDFEIVSCYNAVSGKPVWVHRDAARFYESNGGAGPRGTPTLHDGLVYTLGATGILNALDAGNGAVVWTRNSASDTHAKTPGWGFSGSPLVVDDSLVVATSGRLAAYDLSTGAPRWVKQEGGAGYSSPQLLTIGGVAQVVFINGQGAMSVAPADGTVLWTYAWPGSPIVQPAITADGGVLLSTSEATGATGTRRLAVANGPGGWTVTEVWRSNGLKPYFNDFVVHNGHAYGFDGAILSCIDLQDGKRKWKGGRYGNGQMLLLADQDLLLIVTEEGEIALVGAVPGQFTELGRVPALKDKTWGHPVLAGDILLVRNGEEMVALRLAREGG